MASSPSQEKPVDHIKTHEQLSAVVQFIVDNHHAMKEVKSMCHTFHLSPSDEKEIDKMVEDEEPIFYIVYEILEKHKAASHHPPTLKSIAELFTKMGLMHLAVDIEKLAETANFR